MLEVDTASAPLVEWILFRQLPKPIRKTETVEIFLLLEVVASIVGRHPVRDGDDVQMHFLRGLSLPNEHLARRNKAVDKVQFRVVQMKRLSVHFAVHVRVGQKNLCRAALRHDRQHPRLLKLFDGLRRKDHRGFVLAPRLLRLQHVIANRLVLNEEPRLIEQEDLERGELLRVGNFIRRAVQNIKQQWLQNLRRVIPTLEIERLKAGKRKRVLSVVEEKAILSATRPAVQAFLQLTDDVGKVRDRALAGLQHVDALDRIPEPAFLLEVDPVTLFVALNEHAEEAEEKLQIRFCPGQGEWVDGEVTRLLADVEVRAPEYRRKRSEAAANIEDEGPRCILLRVLQQKITKIRFATPAHPEDQCVGNVAGMQVEEVGRAVVGFEHGEVFRAEIRVGLLAGKDRKQKRQVRVVRVQQVQLTKV